MGKHARRCQRPTRDDKGLTTLEWLLILGAVAGLAALAVVLVYHFVEDTGERFAAPIPRRTVAAVQAAEVVSAAKSAAAGDFDTWDEWERYFGAKCRRIDITIGDERIAVATNVFMRASGGTAFDANAASYAATADAAVPTASKAQADCTVR